MASAENNDAITNAEDPECFATQRIGQLIAKIFIAPGGHEGSQWTAYEDTVTLRGRTPKSPQKDTEGLFHVEFASGSTVR